MPTFVVSLFLPYTIDFHDLPDEVRQTPAASPATGDYFGSINDRASLLRQSDEAIVLPNEIGLTPGQQQVFAPIRPSAATHFAKPHDPKALMRSDAHVPSWTGGILFNQPQSRAEELPPSRLLGYNPPNEHRKQSGVGIGQPSKKDPFRKSNSQAQPTGARPQQKWGSEWTIEPAEQGNGGLSNAVKAAIRENSVDEDIIWMGTLGLHTDRLENEVKNDISEKLEAEYDAVAVYVDDSDFNGHYTHYCKVILWPVFHYQIPDHPKSKAYEDHSYGYYKKLNQAFADKIVANFKHGDIIWIHDYHLLLVPAMVRAKLPGAKIGFFLHTAFPSSEVFRCLSVRKELLEGMLGANLVAFQCPEYQDHFITTCSRLLIVEAKENGVQLEDRFVNVICAPIGIDPAGLADARQEPEVMNWVQKMMDAYSEKTLIVARDKLDHVHGVRQKLLAFELFLNMYPEYKDRVVLIQVATSTTENTQLADVISEIVTRIESEHNTITHKPLVFLRQDIAFSQYLAMLAVADALMVTSLREGMNLTCHEFILCQDGIQTPKKHGPIILSEFTGSSSIFKGDFLSINPWDYRGCAEAIRTALEMDRETRKERHDRLRSIVLSNTGNMWMKTLSDNLNACHSEHQQRDNTAIPRLSNIHLGEKYRASASRIFFLDYDGTLASSQFQNAHVSITSAQRILDILNQLLLDDCNIIYIMSDRMPEELERIFNRVANIGLIAENGCFIRPHNGGDEWISLASTDDVAEWKDSVKKILQYYHERIDKSKIKERHCSLTFCYEDVTPDQSDSVHRQVGDCANHINDSCASHRIHAVPVEKGLLIEPVDWTKGSAAKHVFESLRTQLRQQRKPEIDFLFVAGDGREDEVVFNWANKVGEAKIVKEVTTVSLGKRNTEAATALAYGTSGLLSVLQKLTKLK